MGHIASDLSCSKSGIHFGYFIFPLNKLRVPHSDEFHNTWVNFTFHIVEFMATYCPVDDKIIWLISLSHHILWVAVWQIRRSTAYLSARPGIVTESNTVSS